jgi:hypothetical protein
MKATVTSRWKTTRKKRMGQRQELLSSFQLPASGFQLPASAFPLIFVKLLWKSPK